MKVVIASLIICVLSQVSFAGPNDSNLTDNETRVQNEQKNRDEMKQHDQMSQPNSKSTPTKIDTSSWGIDSNTRFDITNHLFGYSMISDSDYLFQGVKITGFFNVAYYSPDKNNDKNKKKGLVVFGFEEPFYDLNNRASVFGGVGATMMAYKSMYLDLGVDYHLLSWFKLQGGLNWNMGRGVAVQASAGFTW